MRIARTGRASCSAFALLLTARASTWIEQLGAENITGGCGGGNYCPLSNNTRGQMAVFITKTFSLQ